MVAAVYIHMLWQLVYLRFRDDVAVFIIDFNFFCHLVEFRQNSFITFWDGLFSLTKKHGN